MVSAVRCGISQRAVARQFRVSLSTVQYWVHRAAGKRLDRVDWTDRPSIPRRTRRTVRAIEDTVVTVRRELKEASVLGEYGAPAIRDELHRRDMATVPSVRTIGRILLRRGVLEGCPRVRRPAPPPGWYLPEVAQGHAELESFDVIEGLVILHGPQVDVLTSITLHGGEPDAWPTEGLTARLIADLLVSHWRVVGLPAYAQFDNETRFHGPHHYPDVISRVVRVCLSLGVTPVFVPPQEMGFQAAIESFNGRWQAKVWARFHHESLAALQDRSATYGATARARTTARREGAPARRPFSRHWRFNAHAPLRGRLVFLRRTNARGAVSLLGHTFEVARLWPHRLVRCEVDLDVSRIRFYALRRRTPARQPLLKEIRHALPTHRETT